MSTLRLVAVPALAMCFASGVVAQDSVTSVSAEQSVTIEGEFPSLQGLITDLCFKARIKLLSYDVPSDRSVRVRLSGVPLAQALRSLLRQESYAVGMRKRADGGPEIAWLRVLGDAKTAQMRGSIVSPKHAKAELWVPPEQLAQAFGAADETTRLAALTTMSTSILNDPSARDAFLRTDPRAIANALRAYPRAAQTLQSLIEKQAPGPYTEHLQGVLSALTSPPPTIPKFR
jgi:hypothetical protein